MVILLVFFLVFGLSKFFGVVVVVDQIDFVVEQGVVVGVLGLNGVGKMLLFYFIIGVLCFDGGCIEFQGWDII